MNKLYYFLLIIIPLGTRAQTKPRQMIIDSLVNKLSTCAEDTNRIKLLDIISFSYSDLDPDKGIQYGLEAVALSERSGWTPGLAAAYADLGINYAAKSDRAKAIDYDIKALDLFEKQNNKNGMAGIMANLSLVYLAGSNYPKALEYDFNALKIKEELGDDRMVAIILENIGTIYLEQKNYSKTMEYYNKSLETYEKLNDTTGIARGLGNKGIVEDAKGNYIQALQYHLRALETNEKYGNKHIVQINLANVGIVYSHLADYAKALEYQFMALNTSEELGNKNSIAINLGNIGETYLFIIKDNSYKIVPGKFIPAGKTANLNRAISHLEKAVSLCREINYSAPQIEFEQYLSEAYRLAGNYQKALDVFKTATNLKDTLFSQQSKIKLSDLETQREIDLKDRDIIIKNKQIEIAQLEAANKRIERIAFIAIIILLVVIMGLAIRKFMKRIKVQRSALDDIAGIHAHDIRGPLARIIGLTQLFNHDDASDPVNKELIHAVYTVSLQLDEIVKKIVHKTSA